MNSPTVKKLIELFGNFPTVGPRTAGRFVSHLMKMNKQETEEFITAVLNLKKKIKICPSCFLPFEPFDSAQGKVGEFCPVCSSPSRDKSLICVVANEIDLHSIEKTKKFHGLYFVFGGTFSTLKKAEIQKLKNKELFEKIRSEKSIKEVILAFNSNTEGEATALYIERLLKPLNTKITHLGRGLPVGGELEYADEETLSSALEGRK